LFLPESAGPQLPGVIRTRAFSIQAAEAKVVSGFASAETVYAAPPPRACFIVPAGVMRRRANGFMQPSIRWNGTARHPPKCHIL